MDVKNQKVNPEIISSYSNLAFQFDKILRSIRLYELKNKTFVKHTEEFLTVIEGFFKSHSIIQFELGPDSLQFKGNNVFSFDDNKHPFHQLYQETLRFIEIKPQVTPAEIISFLSLIRSATSLHRKDSDAFTILWEQEFENIRYAFAEAIVSLDQQSNTLTQEQKVEQILDRVPQTSKSLPQNDDIQEISDELKITLNPKSMGSLFIEKQVLNTQELQEIQKEILQADRLENILLDFSDMLLAILIEETKPREFHRYIEALSKSVNTLLGEGSFSIANMIIEQLYELHSKNKHLSEHRELHLKLMDEFWSESLRNTCLDSLKLINENNIEFSENLISMIPASHLDELITFVLDTHEDKHAQLIARAIARIHQGDLGVFSKHLNRCDASQKDRFLYLFSLLKSPKLISFLSRNIRTFMGDHTPKILQILKKVDTPQSAELVLEFLKNPSENIRILSLKTLSEMKQPDLAKRLLSHIIEEKFVQKHINEKKAFFYATSKLVKNDFLPFLTKHLKKKNWLNSTKLEEQHMCALIALQANPSKESTQMIQNFKSKASSTLKTQCDIILKQRQS